MQRTQLASLHSWPTPYIGYSKRVPQNVLTRTKSTNGRVEKMFLRCVLPQRCALEEDGLRSGEERRRHPHCSLSLSITSAGVWRKERIIAFLSVAGEGSRGAIVGITCFSRAGRCGLDNVLFVAGTTVASLRAVRAGPLRITVHWRNCLHVHAHAQISYQWVVGDEDGGGNAAITGGCTGAAITGGANIITNN